MGISTGLGIRAQGASGLGLILAAMDGLKWIVRIRLPWPCPDRSQRPVTFPDTVFVAHKVSIPDGSGVLCEGAIWSYKCALPLSMLSSVDTDSAGSCSS